MDEELERLQASIQTCEQGHKYLANSPEYPCPWCEATKYVELSMAYKRDLSELEQALAAKESELEAERSV